ncbi:MAG: peptidoglycan editing factor PgeF [Lachnospiraceae bacterium]|nr:peptidoglycan editing factor PgeF [Lachnospiraceae bacterium]
MDYEIVLAKEEDRAEILRLYRLQKGREYCPWDEDYPSDETVSFDLSRDALFVLKTEGSIKAAVSIEEDEDVDRLGCWDKELAPGGELARLAVLPEEQNRGLARILLQFGMEELKRRGYRSIHFLVNKHNIKALKSYAVFGFRTVGECHMYEQDFLCYEKELSDRMTDTRRSKLITFPHGFSTRNGGVSTGIFESLNLGMNRGDNEDSVKENYKRFFASCGIGSRSFVCGKQVHGKNVMIVDQSDAREPYGYEKLFEADGYVTKTPGVPLVVFTADCIPLLLADEKNRVVAAVHSGWRGTVQDIEKEAVEKMLSLGAETEEIKACIGPAIGYCCFEVGEEVIDAVNELLKGDTDGLYTKKENGRYMLDLKTVVKKCLLRSGIREEHIEIIEDCTMCLPGKYWSHRYTNGERGSQAAAIMI